MRLVITGASGFVGRNLLASLPAGIQALACYNKDATFPHFVDSLKNPSITIASFDLTKKDHPPESLQSDFDVCIHLAANGDPARSTSDPAYDLSANTLSVLNALSIFNPKRFILFSSGAVYDGLSGLVGPSSQLSPHLPYAISKLAAEYYVKSHYSTRPDGGYIVVRFFGAYGSHELPRKIYRKLAQCFALDKNPTFSIRGDGRNLIDAMYIDDATRAVWTMVNSRVANITIDLCSGTPLTIHSLVSKAAAIYGIENPAIHCSGHVPEYINFWASPTSMETVFDFRPEIDLSTGLQKLHSHLLGA